MASGSKKAIVAALIGNALIAIAKYIGAFLTGSSAMLSEGIHSTVDTGNQLLLMLGLKRAKKPPTDEHPFGYGKEVYFWSFAVAIVIFGVGAGISIYEGIHSLLNPHPVSDVVTNYIILGIAIVFEATVWVIALKQFRKTKTHKSYLKSIKKDKDPTTYVVLFEDTAALSGLVVALVGIYLSEATGILAFDGIASIIIGVILGITAAFLAYETKSLLIGESADPEIVQGIEEIAAGYDEIEAVHDILTVHMGPKFILVTTGANFRDDLNADGIEQITQKITGEIKETYPLVKKVFIEAEKM